MLSAQLQNLDVMIELLVLGGNLNVCDSAGFSPLAYASSLPVPKLLSSNVVAYMLEGDSHGVRKMTSADILKTAVTFGVGDLKDELEQNRDESSDEKIEAHLGFLRLLEKYGLTRMETRRELLQQAEGSLWRIEQVKSSLGTCVL